MREKLKPLAPADARRLTPSELASFRKREAHGLSRFFAVYFDRVYALACRLVANDRSLAEDMTQEVFLKIHRAAHQLSPGKDPWPWVVTITCNTCRDHWGSASTRAGTHTRAVTENAAQIPRSQQPDSLAVAREDAETVRQALASLPDATRAVLVLHEFEGLTHEAIGELLNTKPATIRKQHSRGLQTLSRWFEGRML